MNLKPFADKYLYESNKLEDILAEVYNLGIENAANKVKDHSFVLNKLGTTVNNLYDEIQALKVKGE